MILLTCHLSVWLQVFYVIGWGPQPKVIQENVKNEMSHMSFPRTEMCIY